MATKLRREAFQECIGKIAAQAGVDQDRAFQILQTVADHGDQMRRAGQENPFGTAAAEMGENGVGQAMQDRADALRNALARETLMDRVREGGGIRKAALVLRSILHGTNAGDRDSVQALARGQAASWQAALSFRLKQLGIAKASTTRLLDREASEALFAMSNGQEVPKGVSKPARALADAIRPALEAARNRLNAAGARIANATDFVAHTSHDPLKMRRAAGFGRTIEDAFESWWKFTEPLAGERTFEGVTPRDGESVEAARKRFGRSFYQAYLSGIHLTQHGADGLDLGEKPTFPGPAFEGTGNVARKLSQGRVLFFRDGESWNSYMERFGRPRSLTQGVMEYLDQSSRRLALMQKLGTNPAGNLNLVIRKIEEEGRDDLDGLKQFQSSLYNIRNVMSVLDGSANIPANEMAARINASLRTWEAMTQLGGVGITHFASIWPTVTSEMVHHGVSRAESMGRMIQGLVRGARGTAERQEILSQLGAFAAGLQREMHMRWQADDPVPGRISALAATFMKYTGIHYVFDCTQGAVREMLAHNLARNVGAEYGGLNANLRQILGKYRIGSDEWDLLRGAQEHLPSDGERSYMTPNMAYRTDPARIETLLAERGQVAADADRPTLDRAIGNFQDSLADSLHSYYADAAAHSVVTAGARERAFILQGTKPGSVAGELLRHLGLYKSWPLAAIYQVWGREYHMAISKGQFWTNVGMLVGTSAFAGYMRMCINDVARGNQLRNPLDPRTMMAGLAQGGGIGIIGDYLFGEANRAGGGFLGTLAGPVIGDAALLAGMFQRFRDDALRGDPNAYQHAWPELFHWGVGKIPFANLVYIKGALDFLLLRHLMEAMDPGSWERSNQRMQREQGRTMAGYQPGGGVPWGLPGLYLAPPHGQATGIFAPSSNAQTTPPS